MIFSKVALASLLPVCAGEPQGDDAAVSRNYECRPTRRWNEQHVSSGHLEIDVGVVAKNIGRVDCPSDQTCAADATSSLGGRCVSSADAARRTEERLGPCYFTCRDPAVCKASYHRDRAYYQYHGDADIRNAAISTVASSCRNGDIEECFPDEVVAFEASICPFYECLDDGGESWMCRCHALEEGYNLCKKVYGNLEDLDEDTYCGYAFETFNGYRYQCETEGYNQNTIYKRFQLIDDRYDECKNRHSEIASMEEEETHPDECYCQYQGEMCKLHTDLGWYEERDSPYCPRANCCDQRDTEVGFFECVELAFVRYEDGGIKSANDDTDMNSMAPTTTQNPTNPPSTKPTVEASPEGKQSPKGSGKNSVSAGSSALALTATVVGVVASALNQYG